MALTPEQRLSILDAGTRLHAKGKLLNLDLRRMARNAAPPSKQARVDAAAFSRPQPAPSASAPPVKPRTPNATG